MSESSSSGTFKYLKDMVEHQLSNETDEISTKVAVMHVCQEIKNGNAEALPLLESLVSAGKAEAMISLADLLYKGDALEGDRDRAMALLTQAADLGSIRAMIMLSSRYESYDNPENAAPEKSRYWLRKAANLGDETASYCLAERLVAGRSVEQCTPEEAADIEQLYEQSHYTSNAYYKMAMFHSRGKQSSNYSGPEFATAVSWLRRGKARHEGGGKICAEQLVTWGLERSEEELSAKQKAPLWAFLVIPISLIFWAVVGSGLLAVANAINAVTVPIIIVIAIVITVATLVKKR